MSITRTLVVVGLRYRLSKVGAVSFTSVPLSLLLPMYTITTLPYHEAHNTAQNSCHDKWPRNLYDKGLC